MTKLTTISLFFAIVLQTIQAQTINPLNDTTCGIAASQYVSMTGYFNIRFLSDQQFEYRVSDSIKIEPPVKMDSIRLQKEFQKLFPEIFDGNCLNVKTKISEDKIFKYCLNQTEDSLTTKVVLDFYSKNDQFYIIEMSGFEFSLFISFSLSDSLFYFTQGIPHFSSDYDYIFAVGSYLHMGPGLQFDMIDLKHNRSITYELGRYYVLDKWNILKYQNGFYGFAISVIEPNWVETQPGQNEQDNSRGCNYKILID
jgi:hypothetical protein